jgi:hypothetical protein
MEEDEEAGGLREIGHLASWSVTSAKPGNGVELLRDGNTATFWQCAPGAGWAGGARAPRAGRRPPGAPHRCLCCSADSVLARARARRACQPAPRGVPAGSPGPWPRGAGALAASGGPALRGSLQHGPLKAQAPRASPPVSFEAQKRSAAL